MARGNKVGDEKQQSEVSATTPLGGFSIKSKQMAEIIAILSLIALCILAYAFFKHDSGTSAFAQQIVNHMDRTDVNNNEAQRKVAEALVLNACLVAQPQDLRALEFSSPNSFCNRMSKIK